MNKIVVLDGYTLNPGDLSWEGLKALGDVVCYNRTAEDEIVKRIGDAEIIVTNKTPINRETVNACPNLKFIAVLATGYNVVDVQAAKENGILVSNVPTYGTTSVAQFVFALLLEICHHVQHHCNTVIDGRWSKQPDFCYWDYPLIELADKTMGIIGFGKIGKAVGKIALAFGMNVLAFDEYVDKSVESDKMRYVGLDELFEQSDVISLHCPLYPSTKHMIKMDTIAKMKNGVIIINTSRGPLVVEKDVREALSTGKVSWYAADVVSSEPIKMDNALLGAENLLITPHIAWAPLAARERLMQVAIKNVSAFLKGNPINVVN